MTAPTTKILARIRALLDGLAPSYYWYAVFEAAHQLGDPAAPPPSKEAVARILAAFAVWSSVDIATAIAAAKPAAEDPPEGWEERAMERWRREAKPPSS